MRFFNLVVFDEFVPAGVPIQTSASLDDLLGRYDILAIQAVVENPAAAGGSIAVNLIHSGDGENWLSKQAAPQINTTFTASGVTSLYGADSSGNPNLEFVRLRLTLVTTAAHVRLIVTARDTDMAGTLNNFPAELGEDGEFHAPLVVSAAPGPLPFSVIRGGS